MKKPDPPFTFKLSKSPTDVHIGLGVLDNPLTDFSINLWAHCNKIRRILMTKPLQGEKNPLLMRK